MYLQDMENIRNFPESDSYKVLYDLNDIDIVRSDMCLILKVLAHHKKSIAMEIINNLFRVNGFAWRHLEYIIAGLKSCQELFQKGPVVEESSQGGQVHCRFWTDEFGQKLIDSRCGGSKIFEALRFSSAVLEKIIHYHWCNIDDDDKFNIIPEDLDRSYKIFRPNGIFDRRDDGSRDNLFPDRVPEEKAATYAGRILGKKSFDPITRAISGKVKVDTAQNKTAKMVIDMLLEIVNYDAHKTISLDPSYCAIDFDGHLYLYINNNFCDESLTEAEIVRILHSSSESAYELALEEGNFGDDLPAPTREELIHVVTHFFPIYGQALDLWRPNGVKHYPILPVKFWERMYNLVYTENIEFLSVICDLA